MIDERYEIVCLIGQGGMGAVYRVIDRSTGDILALKMLNEELANNARSARRFEQEVKALVRLDHPNVVRIRECGLARQDSKSGMTTLAARPYMVMDFIAGRSLADLLREDISLSTSGTLDICRQVCEALIHAHSNGIVHRDLKPANIMLAQTGQRADPADSMPSKTSDGADSVKILDFGIATAVQNSEETRLRLTQTGQIFGSPLYMSPQQCRGETIDARTDIYSLGCVMYECLSGNPPFTGANPVVIILDHLGENPAPFARHLGIPRSLQKVVFTCLRKDPRERYQSAQMLKEDLLRISHGKGLKRGVSPLVILRRSLRSRQARIMFVTLCCIPVLIGGALLWNLLKGADWQAIFAPRWRVLQNDAITAASRSDAALAIVISKMAVEEADKNASPAERADCLRLLAECEEGARKYSQASKHYAGASELNRDAGLAQRAEDCLLAQARVEHFQDSNREASRIARAAYDSHWQRVGHDDEFIGQLLLLMGRLDWQERKLEQARSRLYRSLKLLERGEDYDAIDRCYRFLYDAAVEANNLIEADQILTDAVNAASRAPEHTTKQLIELLGKQAQLLGKLGRMSDAAKVEERIRVLEASKPSQGAAQHHE